MSSRNSDPCRSRNTAQVSANCVSRTGTIYTSDWRYAMLNSQVRRKLWLAVVATGLLTLAGCSNQATKKGAATAPAKKVAPAKQAKKAETRSDEHTSEVTSR